MKGPHHEGRLTPVGSGAPCGGIQKPFYPKSVFEALFGPNKVRGTYLASFLEQLKAF